MAIELATEVLEEFGYVWLAELGAVTDPDLVAQTLMNATDVREQAGRSAIEFPERRAMDLELVRSLKPRTYLTILARTLPALITGKGAW